jgi:hypothetical protein
LRIGAGVRLERRDGTQDECLHPVLRAVTSAISDTAKAPLIKMKTEE